jgi:uncharacterized lipoprotein NlpE involved in copper resistance
MKTILTILTSILLLTSCNNKEQKWKYEIHGFVETKKGPHEAIWYTDTITLDNDGSLHYDNSDGSRVIIKPPFILHDNSIDSTYINK